MRGICESQNIYSHEEKYVNLIFGAGYFLDKKKASGAHPFLFGNAPPPKTPPNCI